MLRGFVDQQSEPIRVILEAAEHCLGASGYGGMSMRDIAREAGVSKSLLHYHFQSKEHLLIELQIRVYNRLLERVHRAIEAHAQKGRPGFATLDALFEVVSKIDDVPVQAELWARSMGNHQVRENLIWLRRQLHEVLVDAIEKMAGQAVGRLPMTVPTMADMLLGSVLGLGLQAMVDRSRQRVERAYHGLREILDILKTMLADACQPSETSEHLRETDT
jgi:AcrR family transcriptional regulator